MTLRELMLGSIVNLMNSFDNEIMTKDTHESLVIEKSKFSN